MEEKTFLVFLQLLGPDSVSTKKMYFLKGPVSFEGSDTDPVFSKGVDPDPVIFCRTGSGSRIFVGSVPGPAFSVGSIVVYKYSIF